MREVKRPADQTMITPMTRCRFVLNEKVGGQKLSMILVESCIGPNLEALHLLDARKFE